MSILLSQKKIGRRLNEIRKMKGLSQEELAKSVKISRPSLAQIESGNRRIDILELQKLSLALGFSLDAFMAGEFFQGASKSGKGRKKTSAFLFRRCNSISLKMCCCIFLKDARESPMQTKPFFTNCCTFPISIITNCMKSI